MLWARGTPETSLANLATKSVPVNTEHNDRPGINTKDIKEIYVPALPFKKVKINKRKKIY